MSLLRTIFAKKAREHLPSVALLVIFLTVIILLLQLSVFSFILHPIQATMNGFATAVARTYKALTTEEPMLAQERDYFRTLAQELAVDQSVVSSLKRENEELKTLIRYKETIENVTIPARVLARSIEGERTLLIDKGQNDGVREGAAIVVEDGQIVGTVLMVREKDAVVLLAANPISNIPAKILGGAETTGVVQGQEGFLLHMNYIPQDIEVNVNDVVVTSQLNTHIPPDLIIGIVDSVVVNETSPFKEAFIRPLYDSLDFTTVLVVDPVPVNYD